MEKQAKKAGHIEGAAEALVESKGSEPVLLVAAGIFALLYWLDRLTGGHLPHIQRKEQRRLELMQRDHDMLRRRLF